MSKTERIGFAIVATVFILVVGWLLCGEIFLLSQLVTAPSANWLQWAKEVVTWVLILFGLVMLGRAFWTGHEAARWVIFIVAVIFAVGIIGTAVWLTTLDYPNAKTPEIRAEMQADDRQQLPWRILLGIVPIVLGALLFLPPVGQFLSHRRRARAEPDVAPDRRPPT